MTGLDYRSADVNDTSTHAHHHSHSRVIIGRFPGHPWPSSADGLAAVASARPPAPPLGTILAEAITHPPAPRSQVKLAGDLLDYLRWLFDRPDLTLPRDPATLRGVADPWPSAADGPLGIPAALDRLCAVTEGDITAYLTAMGPTGRALALTTINGRLTMLRGLYRRLDRYCTLPHGNPLAEIRSRKTSQMSTTAWLTTAQARALLDTCTADDSAATRDRAILTLMLYTGLRASEARTLRADALQLAGGHAIAYITGKGGRRERVKLQRPAVAALRDWLARAAITDGYAFPGRNPGQPLSVQGFSLLLHRRFRQAALPNLVPHSLRHTFITLALKGGASLPLVQHAARHANPQTTMRYAHELDGLDHNATDYITI